MTRRRGVTCAAIVATLSLGACRENPSPALPNIPCAHPGVPLAPTCTYERTGDTLLIRHPDGAFRRFRVANGTLLTDGAQPPRIDRTGNTWLVEVAGDRYQLPAP